MNCRDLERDLQTYLDGEFLDGEEREIESHFKFCPACQSRVRYERWFRIGLKKAIKSETVPVGLKRELKALEKKERNSGYLSLGLKLAPVGAVAAVFMVVFFQPKFELTPMVDAAVERHAKELPYDIQSDDFDQVRSYLIHKAGFAVPSMPFESARMRLVGARVSPVNERAAAYLGFVRDGRRYSMLVSSDPAMMKIPVNAKRIRSDKEAYLVQRRGFNVVVWRDRQLVYSLVAEESPNDIIRVALGN